MNILFVSHLGPGVSAGPHWSVPARVKAQTRYDNVLWVNTVEVTLSHYLETGVYHTISEYDKMSLDCFPKPFNHPDVVAFEGFYGVDEPRFAKELRRKGIPYIITPRGSLTRQARHNGSHLKKDIAHLLMFDGFQRGALAIQYLTRQEQEDSRSPCNASYVLPNGFTAPKMVKQRFLENGIKGIFIGRIDLYHKGLDNLVQAISSCLPLMKKVNFRLDVYGPLNDDAKKLQLMAEEKGVEELVNLKGEISGDAKQQVLLDADVFFLTSRFEGHPMGLVEALAYGLPCLVSTGSNMREEIEVADAGWTCGTDSETLAQALIKMANEKELFEEKSRNALTLAKQYDWDLLAKKFHEKIEELI